jgi:hypothetical protein
MNIQAELNKLNGFYDDRNIEAFKVQTKFINENFTSDSDEEQINSFIDNALTDLHSQTKELINDISLHLKLAKISA